MDENTISKNWGIIPEFFYDLISRIPPGILLFTMLLFEFNIFSLAYINESLKIEVGSAFIIFFTFLTCGYVLGSLLSIVGSFITKKFYTPTLLRNVIKEDTELVKSFISLRKITNINLDNIDSFTDNEFYKIYRESHDYIKLKDERIKTLLPKLSAEASLHTNLVASLFMLLTIHLINRICYSSFPFLHWSIYVWGIITIIFLIWIGKLQYKKLLRFQFSFLRYVVNNSST
ncbi:MAG: hypothetical protein KF721_09110 [Ignavibacteriaceae bacterium]|nr:hypothetical protein [Ignavibacteriaceae bacterium]